MFAPLISTTGSALNWDGYFNTQIEGEVFASVIDLVLNCSCFMYIGAWLPFTAFNSPELGITPWRLVVLFLAASTSLYALKLLHSCVHERHNPLLVLAEQVNLAIELGSLL